MYGHYPTNVYLHKHLEPVYEIMPGWKQDISDAKSFEELPQKAQNYLNRIQELINVPISIISIGPEREETIIIENPITASKSSIAAPLRNNYIPACHCEQPMKS
jgi:adenylosuccinate synthase